MPRVVGGGGAVLLTVTVTPVLVVVFPVASRATAVRTCAPFVVSSGIPTGRVGGCGVFAPQRDPVELKSHSNDTDIVRCSGGNGDCGSGDCRTTGRRSERDGRELCIRCRWYPARFAAVRRVTTSVVGTDAVTVRRAVRECGVKIRLCIHSDYCHLSVSARCPSFSFNLKTIFVR